jgi:preprotein translocase subunit SecG
LQTFLLLLLILDGIILTVVVLLQSGTGGGLASMGGGMASDSNLIGGRQAVTLLTKATWITGGLFLGLALLLSVLSSRQSGTAPVLRSTFQGAPAPATAPPTGAPAPIPGTTPTTPDAPAADAGGAGDAGTTTPPATTPATTGQ